MDLIIADDQETGFPRPLTRLINPAGRQRRAGFGEVVKLAPRERSRGERQIIALTFRIEPFNDQFAAARGFDHG
jgi:hypothetical protein